MNRFTAPLNNEVIKDVLELRKEIEEEKKKDNPDPKELEKLYLRQLYRGMEINTHYMQSYINPF